MNGDDAVISAETGSGKTLAYLLPILHALLRQCPPVDGVIPAPESPVGLVIVPSVDLVRQVATVAGELVPELVPEGGVFMVHGRYGPTRHDKVAIVVATPKALLEVRGGYCRRAWVTRGVARRVMPTLPWCVCPT